VHAHCHTNTALGRSTTGESKSGRALGRCRLQMITVGSLNEETKPLAQIQSGKSRDKVAQAKESHGEDV